MEDEGVSSDESEELLSEELLSEELLSEELVSEELVSEERFELILMFELRFEMGDRPS